MWPTHDFLKNQESVYHGGSHGGEVLSCLAGRLPDGTCLGLAPGAAFLLARTEQMFRERYAEEEAWLAAAEWADRNGADIINSSLGYTTGRYFPEQMNGRTSLVARAAELAVRKGILVVNAAGNDGDDDEWRTVGTPADGDSVLAAGGLDPDTYLHSDFSSYGPAAGRRLKPNLAAFGTVLAAGPGGYERIEGTSFSSPLLAGFAACAWQHERGLTVMQLFARLQLAGDLYPYYDYAPRLRPAAGRGRAAAQPGARPGAYLRLRAQRLGRGRGDSAGGGRGAGPPAAALRRLGAGRDAGRAGPRRAGRRPRNGGAPPRLPPTRTMLLQPTPRCPPTSTGTWPTPAACCAPTRCSPCASGPC